MISIFRSLKGKTAAKTHLVKAQIVGKD